MALCPLAPIAFDLTIQVTLSLPDRFMYSSEQDKPSTLAVALGANLPSPLGPPIATLIAVRPLIKKIICSWLDEYHKTESRFAMELRWRWSPLYETDPIGGPKNQPPYINAVLVVDGPRLSSIQPCEAAALNLLARFLQLEKEFGRDRNATSIRWGPRSLDLDLLAWGELHMHQEKLTLPHPRIFERDFVVIPLGEALRIGNKRPPRRISPHMNWEE